MRGKMLIGKRQDHTTHIVLYELHDSIEQPAC
jgi:hypothetical protein